MLCVCAFARWLTASAHSEYIGALCDEADITETDLRERVTMTLESATDEPVGAFVDDLVVRWLEAHNSDTSEQAAKAHAAEVRLKESKVLRGETVDAATVKEESLDERCEGISVITGLA